MEAQKAHLKPNDYKPEFGPDGKPTERQIEHERAVLFFQVLRGLGIPRQVTRFIYTIKSLTKPGKLYHFNDEFLAEHLGCDGSATTRNYVVNLRKKMREWNDTYYDEVLKTQHFSFVSIVENEFNQTTKKQIPTGYTFSEKFADILNDLAVKVREHPRYETNWLLAIKGVIAMAGTDELTEFGEWNKRRLKRPRTPEDILGTLLLNWRRLTKKIIDTGVYFGYPADATADYLQRIGPMYIFQARADANLHLSGPTITTGAVKKDGEFTDVSKAKYTRLWATPDETKQFFDKVFSYVAEREYRDGGNVLDFKLHRAEVNDGENGDLGQFHIANVKRADGDKLSRSPVPAKNDFQFLQDSELAEAMDQQRERYLESVRGGSGTQRNGAG